MQPLLVERRACRSAARTAARPASRCRCGCRRPGRSAPPARGSCTPACRSSGAKPVNSVFSVSCCPVALATPKSITFGHRRRRRAASTSTFDGLRSRWMIPFWWACCTAWQTGTNSSSRCRGVQVVLVAVLGDRHALDQLHHEVRPAGRRSRRRRTPWRCSGGPSSPAPAARPRTGRPPAACPSPA